MAEAVPAPFDRPDAGFNNLPGWSWVARWWMATTLPPPPTPRPTNSRRTTTRGMNSAHARPCARVRSGWSLPGMGLHCWWCRP
ncbi:MAG: hypothetical protein EB096_13125 [Betaproteobacteria bacterium]|nr:hypothetical protein [Betaproteobacteria bacterium]